MSEPSPEAKQAAANWWIDGNSNVAAHMAYAIGYDTATAKLREELEIMTRSRDAWQETAAQMTQNYADAKDKLAQAPTNSREAALIKRIEELESLSFFTVSSNIAKMVTAYIEGKGGTDWRNGLPEIIAARLKRLQMRRDAEAPASPAEGDA